ncbi:DUF6114 domain-containing protein [Actinomadura kijaniata]|uniref:DUF6114 domain-containing protein n=1 Tax=Actinomadura kijaniata TaxID=46161 RepID=UPI003F1CA359
MTNVDRHTDRDASGPGSPPSGGGTRWPRFIAAFTSACLVLALMVTGVLRGALPVWAALRGEQYIKVSVQQVIGYGHGAFPQFFQTGDGETRPVLVAALDDAHIRGVCASSKVRSPLGRRWRTGRPFWAGLFTLLGGITIAALPAGGYTILRLPTLAHLTPLAFGGLITALGATLWTRPSAHARVGTVVIILALATFLYASLGGYLLGTLLASLGFAWRPSSAGRTIDDRSIPRRPPTAQAVRTTPPDRQALAE